MPWQPEAPEELIVITATAAPCAVCGRPASARSATPGAYPAHAVCVAELLAADGRRSRLRERARALDIETWWSAPGDAAGR